MLCNQTSSAGFNQPTKKFISFVKNFLCKEVIESKS